MELILVRLIIATSFDACSHRVEQSLHIVQKIRNPGAARHYGAKNQMTASTPEKLTDTDLDLLVRWMTGDHTASKVPDYSNQMEAVKAAISK